MCLDCHVTQLSMVLGGWGQVLVAPCQKCNLGIQQECGVLQEELLRQLLIESKAYGSLLGSGGVGDPGRAAPNNLVCLPKYINMTTCP